MFERPGCHVLCCREGECGVFVVFGTVMVCGQGNDYVGMSRRGVVVVIDGLFF